MAMLTWQIATKLADYNAIKTKDNNALYFIQETGEIYKGSQSFTESVVFYGTSDTDVRPAVGARGKIYLHATTLAGSIWDGSAYKDVIKQITVDDAVTADGANPVTGKAVADYVASEVGEGIKKVVKTVEYVEDSVALRVTLQDATVSDIPLTKIATQLTYDGATGVLSLLDHADSTLASVNIPLDNFVKEGTYDADTKEIVLTMQNANEVRIPASALVDIYTGDTTSSATVEVSEGNVITATVKVSAAEGNLLEVADDGLKVVVAADATKMDKVEAEHADELLAADAEGNAKLTGVKVGGATLAATPDATTVATEAAVKAVVDALGIEDYVAKADIVVDALNEDAPSSEKVVSEAAVVAALSWKTVASAPAEDTGDSEGEGTGEN